ncbi:MAG: DUF4019 domain-containing protein [Pseudomonadota bacterium]
MIAMLELLTEKEKETLRLFVRGHNAKTAARELALSVHTINERLRAARRKLNVTSSREAARLLLESESQTPKNSGDEQIGDARQEAWPDTHFTKPESPSSALWIGGVLTMLTFVTLSALLLSSGSPAQSTRSIGDPATPIETAQLNTLEASSHSWLTYVDAGNWAASFEATGRSFQQLNTVEGWAEASRQARVPLGAVIERETLTAEFVAAPPMGYAIVRFRTRFQNRSEARENVTLEQENGAWKVVGYVID